MTDKELKKLSRLELLELLLAESRENEHIKEELEKVKQENTIEKSAHHLNETSDKLESVLQKLSSMITELGEVREKECVVVKQTVSSESIRAKEENNLQTDTVIADVSENPDRYVDFNIYKNLIVFFISNPESLDVLPDDLRQTVVNRIEEIKNK